MNPNSNTPIFAALSKQGVALVRFKIIRAGLLPPSRKVESVDQRGRVIRNFCADTRALLDAARTGAQPGQYEFDISTGGFQHIPA